MFYEIDRFFGYYPKDNTKKLFFKLLNDNLKLSFPLAVILIDKAFCNCLSRTNNIKKNIKLYLRELSKYQLLEFNNDDEQNKQIKEIIKFTVTQICQQERKAKFARDKQIKKIFKKISLDTDLRKQRLPRLPKKINFFQHRKGIPDVYLGDSIPLSKQIDLTQIKGHSQYFRDINK